jgi:phosphopantetheine--protein transferase-like protein
LFTLHLGVLMDQIADVRSLIATMLMLPADRLTPDTSLRSLDTSLGGARLILGLKRLGLKPVFHRVPPTFGELKNSLTGERTASPVNTDNNVEDEALQQASPPGALSVGLDIQDLKSLPLSADYWEHEFYQGCFSRVEVAYAVVQSEPRAHFAGFWSAKEALKKCDPSFINVDLTLLTVAHDATGKPFFLYQRSGDALRLPHAISISHSGNMASAVVISMKMITSNELSMTSSIMKT